MSFRAGFVAILGRPNVGKSTFVNAAVGQKVSIVSDRPQTTRNRILGICNRRGAQIVLVDTPGIHKPEHRLNRRMVETSFAEAESNDANLVLIDAADGLGPGDRYVIERAAASGKPLYLGLNKIDLVPKKELLLPLLEECGRLASWRDIVPFAALGMENLEALLSCLQAALPEAERLFPEDQATDQTEQLLVAELVREQVILMTRDEIPFSTAVTVEGWEDKPDITVITAIIWVERERHQGIVIGAAGRMIKAIGGGARTSVEALLGRRVYLDLSVKVREGWREDARFLHRLFPR